MKRLPLLLCVLALSACAGHERRPPPAPWHPPSAMLVKYVTNKDGSLTRAQMEAGLRRDFNAAGKDRTGCLDADEVRAINEQRFAQDQSTASPLVDLTGRGCIDFDAYATVPRSLFDTLDRDNNGVLTAQELHPYATGKKDEDRHGHRRSGNDPDSD